MALNKDYLRRPRNAVRGACAAGTACACSAVTRPARGGRRGRADSGEQRGWGRSPSMPYLPSSGGPARPCWPAAQFSKLLAFRLPRQRLVRSPLLRLATSACARWALPGLGETGLLELWPPWQAPVATPRPIGGPLATALGVRGLLSAPPLRHHAKG